MFSAQHLGKTLAVLRPRISFTTFGRISEMRILGTLLVVVSLAFFFFFALEVL